MRRLDRYAVSHLSAVALWGLPVIADDLGSVHVVMVGGGRARVAGRLRVHPPVRPEDVQARFDVSVVRPHVAVAQVAATSMRAGIVAADGALRAGLTSRAALLEAADRPANRRPVQTKVPLALGERDVRKPAVPAQVVAALASSFSESAGESWTKLVLHGLGLNAEQQVEIRDRSGGFVGRVDFLLRHERVVVEFDGVTKYGGADGREALVREKRREDRLRAMGYHVVRLTWADLRQPDLVLSKIRAVMDA